MRPKGACDAGGGQALRDLAERRVQQLQRQVRVKEESIAELEAENAVLHLKLAESRGRAGRSCLQATWLHAKLNRGHHGHRDAHPVLAQLWHLAQGLQRDVKELRSSSLRLLADCQDQCQAHLSEMAAAVRGAQPSIEALQACQSEALRLERSLQEVELRWHLEKQKRRALHNSLVELKGSIRVHCRIRPLLPFDSEWDGLASHSSSVSPEVVHALDDETILVKCHRPGHPKIHKTYTFERVYGPAESQVAVFADVRPLLTSFLDGYSVCIMAYGQTGSGKSYSMLGPGLPSGAHGDSGVIPRAAEELFSTLLEKMKCSAFGAEWVSTARPVDGLGEPRTGPLKLVLPHGCMVCSWHCSYTWSRLIAENPPASPEVQVSIVEIYNNDVFDLLAKEDSAVSGVKRELVTTQEGRTEVPLLTCTAVASAVELVELVHRGLQLRATHPTLVHAASSRSHLVVTVTLAAAPTSDSTGWLPPSQALLPEHAGAAEGTGASPRAPPARPLAADQVGCVRQLPAKLQLVDLAGSECAGASGVTGLALRETSCINRSLAALADVLRALSERQGHVPYRNSKLTRLLQDSIGASPINGSSVGKV